MNDNDLDRIRGWFDGGRLWCKGALVDGKGGACLLGSMTGASPDNLRRLTRCLTVVIVEQYPDRLRGLDQDEEVVPAFNDHLDTTWADVDSVLDKAARRLDETP